MSAAAQVTQCPFCGTLQKSRAGGRGINAYCCNCAALIDTPPGQSVNRTLAYSLAALMLFIPANLYPVITIELWGNVQRSTIWDSVVSLSRNDMVIIALIVFMASIVVPLIKLLCLFLLALTMRSQSYPVARARLYRVIEMTGHWSMLDIFLVAVLIALLKLGDLAYAVPGPGLYFFTAMVVFTILASRSLNPRLIWIEF